MISIFYKFKVLLLLTSLFTFVFGVGNVFDNMTWQTVGSSGFSAGQATTTSLAIDSSGMPYVAFSDGANSNKATVLKYSGGNWQTVGSADFSPGAANSISLAIDKATGTPYVAFSDGADSDKVTVMKYSGGNWQTVGSAGFSAGMVDYLSIAIDSSENPYVSYVVTNNNNSVTGDQTATATSDVAEVTVNTSGNSGNTLSQLKITSRTDRG